tara:strand:- start:540 stop:827 length:288 start_codon:yes stop_codon:yes gene_type:complete
MARPLITIAAGDIAYIKEDKIKREVFSLENKRSYVLRDRENRQDNLDTVRRLELEVCYLQRELEIRNNRRKAHSEFLQKRSNNNRFNRDNRARRR